MYYSVKVRKAIGELIVIGFAAVGQQLVSRQ